MDMSTNKKKEKLAHFRGYRSTHVRLKKHAASARMTMADYLDSCV
jgi:hypothetical protein